MSGGRAIHSGLVACVVCGRLCGQGLSQAARHAQCPRCHATLHPRKHLSVERTWALLIAAGVLLFPANLDPVMTVAKLGHASTSTILQGVRQLMDDDQHLLALVVLVASVVVPVIKILGLSFLLVSVQCKWSWRPKDRTRLYRLIELIGRWSMLDIFVVAVLIALVKLGTLVSITAEGGAVAFGAVVVLTMLASRSFDPRLIWDNLEKRK